MRKECPKCLGEAIIVDPETKKVVTCDCCHGSGECCECQEETE